MINKLIEIAIHKKGNKRKLGVFLGFPPEYSTQRVNKLLKHNNFKMEVLIGLLKAAEIEEFLENEINKKYNYINSQK